LILRNAANQFRLKTSHMKKYFLLLSCYMAIQFSFGQSTGYTTLIKKADSLYTAKNYKASALAYSKAFGTNEWKGLATDRYNAACSWALTGNADSAFFQLERIIKNANYANYAHITTDTDLNSLYTDQRWKPLLAAVLQNKEKAEANLNRPLVWQLDSIHTEDQQYRRQIESVEKKNGWESKEMKALWETIHKKDSINLVKIRSILDTYGWLGADIIGEQGNQTLFLVIQHSDQLTQEKYLPMMREAVKNGKATGSSLALLEDRVALGQGKKQLYGSQIGRDEKTQAYFVLPLEDPDNVDKRRAEVGLPPLSEYVMYWQIKWNVEEYKKEQLKKQAKKN
jgi:hypothetical protein